MAWPNDYTYNFCPNPSFETDLTGVTAVNGATLFRDPGAHFSGAYSLQVTTPGNQSGEGVILPPGAVLASGTGAVSLYVMANTPMSSGTLNVYAIDLTTSTTLGSTTTEFDPTTWWTRVQITGLSLVSGHNLAVYVETTSPQATSFNIDAVQYEPSLSLNGGTLPTPYIDGDSQFGFWVGTAEESASYKSYQNQLSASGTIATSGSGSLLNIGATFPLVFTDPSTGPTTISGNIDLSGRQFQGLTGLRAGGGTVNVSGITALLMLAGLDDFSIFSPGDIDPAISLVGYNNAGATTGTNTSGSAGYTRVFSTFSAPQAFTGSGTANVWNSAAYFAVGYQISSITANEAQNITHVQAELVPNSGATTVPTNYVRPRALTAILAPTTMNFVTNPGFTNDTAGWTALSGTTLSRVTTHAWVGATSGQMTGTSAEVGAWINVPGLIVGETYTASGYVYASTGVTGITLAVNPVTGFTYTAGETITVTAGAWNRIDVQFTAPASNVNLGVWSVGSGTQTWYLDGVMLNPGGLVNYGDGYSSGWNFEGAAGDSRSYYYERGNIAYAAVQDVLKNHLPLGLTAYDPVYNAPVTQYS